MSIYVIGSLHMSGEHGRKRWRVLYAIGDESEKHTKYFGNVEGPNKVSRREARLRFQDWLRQADEELEAEVQTCPTLGQFLDRYMATRMDIAEGTRRLNALTRRYLIEHFGSNQPIDQITPAMATDWLVALSSGQLDGVLESNRKTPRGPKSEATVCRHVRSVKRMFRMALDERLLDHNPFHHLNGQAPATEVEWHYVDRDEFRKLLTGCRNIGWQVFLALQRLGGLRRQEAYDLPWKNVDFDNHLLRVAGVKTARTRRSGRLVRQVPMNEELEQLLREAFDHKRDEESHVVDRRMVGSQNWLTRFRQICGRADVTPWAAPYQCLRRSRATELAEAGIPTHAHAKFLGHSIAVAERYYLRVGERSFQMARDV